MKETIYIARQAPRPDPAKPPVCRSAALHKLGRVPMGKLAYCPLLSDSVDTLLTSMRAAPQFARLDPEKLLKRAGKRLTVLLLTETDYYARQAALYLASITAQKRGDTSSAMTPLLQSLEDDAFRFFADEEEDPPGKTIEEMLMVLSPTLLDPSIEDSTQDEGAGPVRIVHDKGESKFSFEQIEAPAVLIAAPTGPVLTPRLVEQFAVLREREREHLPDVFVALKPGQVDRELAEELRFSFGFQVVRVGHANRAYLHQVLKEAAAANLAQFAPQTDLNAVVAGLRRYRGTRFEECDLERAVELAIRRRQDQPLRTEDLIPKAYPYGSGAGRQQLDTMIGLEPVKTIVNRMAARAALESRRAQLGLNVNPACRNMAFAGPPGTGKSVTARLVAQILREEGVGTGRFVEAGREQLIGKYLGHTSPLVAKLFRQAQGGVLFIDEAGALLDAGAQDTYTTEAVNALVRHMELEPQTVVIFATYPDEMRQLLASNPGLSSRVAQVVSFEGYDDDRLWDILGWIAHQEGYTLPTDARSACVRFFRTLRDRKKDNFGNGREARRLFQAAVDEAALRVRSQENSETALRVWSQEDSEAAVQAPAPASDAASDGTQSGPPDEETRLCTLTVEDFRLAVAFLLAAGETETATHPIGFRPA